jgi:pyruvate formate lyase activating enzyme
MRLGGVQACSLIDYPSHLSAVVFTIGCNFRCPYCHNPELVEETADELSSKSFFALLEKRQGKLDGVTITGGEPTIHEDLPEFVARIKELGFKVKLDSNGTNPAMLKKLIDAKHVDYLAMDIKAPLATYSQTVGRPVAVDKIIESIEMLKSCGVPYEFRTTVIKSMLSLEDFHQIGTEIKGARQYFLQKFIPTKILNPQFLKKVTYTDGEFAEIGTIMEQYVTTCGIR